MKKISFDVDSVLFDTEAIIIKEIKEIYGVTITQKDVTHWDFYAENFPKILDKFASNNFYETVKKIEQMDNVLESIIEGYGINSLQLVTSTHSNVKNSKEEALNRLFSHIKGFEIIPIIHVGLKETGHVGGEEVHHKYEYSKNTILIDDAIHNIHDHVEINKGDKGLLVDFGYGWNQNYENDNVFRVRTPNEIIEKINEIII